MCFALENLLRLGVRVSNLQHRKMKVLSARGATFTDELSKAHVFTVTVEVDAPPRPYATRTSGTANIELASQPVRDEDTPATFSSAARQDGVPWRTMTASSLNETFTFLKPGKSAKGILAARTS